MTDASERPGDDQTESERISAQLHDAIAEVMSRNGLMVTKWITAIEVIDSDGSRDMDAYVSPDFRSWGAVGLLGFLDARERGVIGAEAAEEFGEDSD